MIGRSRPVVPVVRMAGMIAASASLRRGVSLVAMAPLLEKAFTYHGAVAVALVINSPGGSPVQSALIFERIRNLSRKHDKPVIAFVEDMAASGGYWLACAADEIIVSPASIVGSIGVVSAGFGFVSALEKLGVERRVYTAGTRKAMLDAFRPENPDDIEHLRSLQQEIHAQFTTMVEQRRGSRLDDDRDLLFSGAFWTGRKAVSLGLADAEGEIRSVLMQRFGDKVELVPIEPRRGILSIPPAGGIHLQDHARLADELVEAGLFRLEEYQLRSRLGL